MADKEKEILKEILEELEDAQQPQEESEAEEISESVEEENGVEENVEAGAEDTPEGTPDGTPEGTPDGTPEGDKKSFFKKKKDKKDEQIDELNDRVKRQMAEFENFRKRTEKEKTQMYDMGAKSIIEKILPVVDNFERGFTMVQDADKEDAFVTGMDKVYKQMVTELESVGVKPIEAVGKEFDPELHNAVMQVESEEYESGVVAQELLKGYMYKDTVVRHSMVAVVS